MLILKNSAAFNIPILMLDSTDHITPKLGLSLSLQINKNCQGFAGPSGSVNEQGLGWYCLSGHLQDTNTYGSLIIHASGSGADMFDSVHEVVAFNPQDPISMGMSMSNGVVVSGVTPTAVSGITTGVFTQPMANFQVLGSGLTLCAVVLENLNSAVSGTTMTIYKADGVTPLMYRAISKTTSDQPIRGIS